MPTDDQEDLKLSIKAWLKTNRRDYAWLADKCFVTESTVRNWMARKAIPAAKAHIISQLVREEPMSLPSPVEVEEETRVTLKLDALTRRRLEEKAFRRGKSLGEFLADSINELADDTPHA